MLTVILRLWMPISFSHIITQVPKSIEKRLNKISSTRADFEDAIPPYQKALDDSGHKYKLQFTEPPQTPNPPEKPPKEQKKTRHHLV